MHPTGPIVSEAMRAIPPRFRDHFPPGRWFDNLPARLLQRLTDYGRTFRFDPGEALVQEGILNEWLHVIVEGRVDLECADPLSGRPIRLLTLGPGDVVGERGLVDTDVPVATARAITEVTTYRLHHPAIAWMLLVVPEAAPRFVEAIRLQIAEINAQRQRFVDPESPERLQRPLNEGATIHTQATPSTNSIAQT